VNRLVLDASVALSWFLPGEPVDTNHEVRKLIEGGARVSVPSVWALEVVNALLSAERGKRISQADSAAAWAALQKLPLETDEETARGSEGCRIQTQGPAAASHALKLEPPRPQSLRVFLGDLGAPGGSI
jgi:hypothetical protein